MKYFAGLSCLLALSLVGCGAGAGGTDIEGTVEYSSGGALPKGVVALSNEANSYRGMIGSDGKYKIEGVVAGTYSVAITGAQEGGDTGEMQYDEQGNYIESKPEPAKPLIKEDYTDATKSGLSITVPGDYNLKVDKAE